MSKQITPIEQPDLYQLQSIDAEVVIPETAQPTTDEYIQKRKEIIDWLKNIAVKPD